MHAFFKAKLDQEGVKVVETWILLQILNGVTTSNAIKKILKVDGAQIQRSCDRLVEKQWVVRTIDPYDRRVKNLSLSPEGEALIKRLIQHSKKTNDKALSHLDDQRKNELRHILMDVLKGPFFE